MNTQINCAKCGKPIVGKPAVDEKKRVVCTACARRRK